MTTPDDPGRPASPSPLDCFELDIDIRMGLEVWELLWASDSMTPSLLASLLRFVYGRGYVHALVEPQRGQLCRDHGFGVPLRRHLRRT